VTSLRLTDADGRAIAALQSGQPAQIVLTYERRSSEPLRNVLVNLYLTTQWGERVCDFQTDLSGDNFAEIPPAGEFVCTIPKVPLQPGTDPLTFRVYASERLALDIVENAASLEVQQGDYFGTGRLGEAGTIFVEHHWQCRSTHMEALR
jgi:lipopolysaccharide transport system ATP-binding protein